MPERSGQVHFDHGKVLDSATGEPGERRVWSPGSKDATGVERITMATLAGSDGSFVLPNSYRPLCIVVAGEALTAPVISRPL